MNTLHTQLDHYLMSITEAGHFFGSVLVAQHGQIIVSKGYGYANLEHQIPNYPNTKFRIGSLGKQFTAMAILLLQIDGDLNITDPIHAYIQDYPNGDQIKIEHLLTHTSGIPNYVPDLDAIKVFNTLLELIERFKTKQLDCTPGERFSYSNPNYILLAYIIEIISGLQFQSCLGEYELRVSQSNFRFRRIQDVYIL